MEHDTRTFPGRRSSLTGPRQARPPGRQSKKQLSERKKGCVGVCLLSARRGARMAEL